MHLLDLYLVEKKNPCCNYVGNSLRCVSLIFIENISKVRFEAALELYFPLEFFTFLVHSRESIEIKIGHR